METYPPGRNCAGGRRLAATLAVLVAALGGSVRAADLTLALTPRWRQQTLAVPTEDCTNTAGQALRITRCAALLSGVSLLRGDGSRVQLDGQYGWIDFESGRNSFTLRGVPDGDYVGLEFWIGVPPEANHADPGQWPANHPLNPLVNGLHWSWQGGYVFLALEGRWHEAGDTRGTERGFSYHLATDARAMTVGFRANYRVAGDTVVRLAFDVARVLASQRLAVDDGSESTHSAEGDALAPHLAIAVERAWFWLEATPAGKPSTLAARSEPAPIAAGTPRAFAVPAGFPQPALPADNPLTEEGVALGETLFFDPRLSRGGTQACASCHAPAHGFADSVAFSRGAGGEPGVRNAMPLANLAWSPAYAWDGRQPRIRDQARAAWTNPVEMGADPDVVIAVLAADAALAARFRAAFGTSEITAERVTLALEQYLLTLVSSDSKFDRALRGAAQLTDEEKRGFELFAMEFDPARGRRGADCFHCHGGALFTDFAFKNNGLELTSRDAGRAAVTVSALDRGKFKTPSLRNVALTAPYMHDGRFATLEEVVAHYDHGVKRAAALDPNLAKHPDAGLSLAPEDQHALVAFLKTLTDSRFTAENAH